MPTTPDAAAVAAGPGRAAALAGLVGILSVVAVDPWGLTPFGTLRWAVVTGSLLLAVLATRVRPALPRLLVGAWVVLLLALLAATLTAVDPVHAWIGTPDRRLGLLAWLGLAAAWVVGAALRTPADRRWMARSACVAGALLAAGAALDALGWMPDSGFVSRVGGTYGQPAYLAAMATLLIPIAIAMAADPAAGRAWRVTGGLAALGSTAALLASGTRGAWLGMGVAAIPLVLRAVRGRARWLTGRRSVVVVLVAAATIGVLAASGIASRAASGLDVSAGTAAGRLAEWRVAARVIGAHPWLGVGPEGYRVAFPAAVDATYGRTYGREVVPDRAHNTLLDVTATGGVVAGAAWLVLLAAVVWRGWRATASHDPVQIGAGAAVIAYGVQQQLLFPLAEVDPVWWLLVGMLGAAELRAADVRAVEPRAADVRAAELPAAELEAAELEAAELRVAEPRVAEPRAAGLQAVEAGARDADKPGATVPAWATPLSAGVRLTALGLLAATAVAGVLGVIADRRMARAADMGRPPTTQAALDLADTATALRPDDIRLWFATSRIAQRGGRITDIDAALDRIDRALALSPRDPAVTGEHAVLLLERARRSRLPDDEAAAITAHRDLVAADPANVGPRIGLATALAYAGDLGEAAAVADQAERLDPRAEALPALRGLLSLLQDPAAVPGDPAPDPEEG